MATLDLLASTDFSGLVLNDITVINYTNAPVRSLIAATFAGAQFDGLQVSSTVAINGSTGRNALVVNGSLVDGSGWAFSTWNLNDSVTINGTSTFDILIGTSQDDRILGYASEDEITGGLGKDILTGGNQGDIFVFNSAAEAGLGTFRDRITDLSLGNDIIDLSGIDAISGGGDDAFSAAGQLRFFVNAAGNTIIQGNTGGGRGAEFEIFLNGIIALMVDEFVL